MAAPKQMVVARDRSSACSISSISLSVFKSRKPEVNTVLNGSWENLFLEILAFLKPR